MSQSERTTTPLSSFTDFISKGLSGASGFSSAELPEQDFRSVYALELAHLFAVNFTIENLEIKGLSKFRRNLEWELVVGPLHLAIAIIHLTALSEERTIFSAANGLHLRLKFDVRLRELGLLVPLEQDNPVDLAAAAARSTRLCDKAVSHAGLRYGSGDELSRIFKITAAAAYANFATKKIAIEKFRENRQPLDDHLAPLRTAPEPNSYRKPNENIPPPPHNETIEVKDHPLRGLSDAGSAEPQYDNWVKYCLSIASSLRIPERLVNDLIPPREVADHSLKNLTKWEMGLEETFPGRRKWLLDEGVTRSDFDTFWGYPSWVQNFIEKVTQRNLELELRGQLGLGKTEDEALQLVAMFIPVYSVHDEEAISEFRHLPIELFERVRRYFAEASDDWQVEFAANRYVTKNQYIRQLILDKRL
ncbi:MAG: hypothetical protein EBU84_05930 [Actinobacteria bacterium]|nr:hypothetical protein [Actinomycetota bacterium]